MKKLTILCISLALSSSIFAYKAKSEDLSKFTLNNYKTQIEKVINDSNIQFDKIGKIYESPNLGYYNFVAIEKNEKVLGFVGLTHIKSYNKHEALLAVISLEGKLLGFYLPDANSKHQNVHDSQWKDKYINKTANEIPVDGLAGSTFHAHSVNGELRNLLAAFNYKKDILLKNN